MYDIPWDTLLQQIMLPGIRDTFIMLAGSVVACFILGLIIAIVLTITDPRGLKPNRVVYEIVGAIVSILYSVPYVILAIALLPLTRTILGSSIGVQAAIFTIAFAGTPFIARLLETSFKEVNPSLVEAAQSFGASTSQIVRKVIIPEAVPAMTSQMTLGVITLLGFTAIAGTIGAGGLGSVALTYGYQNFNDKIMYGTVAILVVIVVLIQLLGNALYRRLK